VGEWSLATCNMYGQSSKLITEHDNLYAMYGAEKSSFRSANASGDFFWTGLVRTGNYDPTVYSYRTGSNGTRAAVEAILERYQADPSWVAANPYVQPPTRGALEDYLLPWSLDALANKTTSDGHAVILPVSCNLTSEGGVGSLCIEDTCIFEPKPLVNMTTAIADSLGGNKCNPETQCHMTPWAPASLVKQKLFHVCMQVDCLAILPGGSHFEPNTLQNHADYAFNRWYQANRGNPALKGIVCYLDGAAYFPQCS